MTKVSKVVLATALVWVGTYAIEGYVHKVKKEALIKQADAYIAETKKPSSGWAYQELTNPLAKGTIKAAIIHSTNSFEFAFPYQGLQNAKLMVRNHPQEGTELMLTIERGQLLCHPGSCAYTILFDDGEPMKLEGAYSSDFNSTVVFLKHDVKLLKKLKTAKKVSIGMAVFQEGVRIFEFDVSNLDSTKI